jgi:hypothetical protein
LGDIPVSRKKDVDQLRQAGLDDKDLRILFDRIRNKTFAHIGRELGMSPQGVWKRYTGRVLPRIKSLNPTFSRPSFELLCLDLK